MMKPDYSHKQEKLLFAENPQVIVDQINNSSNIVGSHFWHRFLLVQGIGWLGGLGIVGGGMVWAQSRTSTDAVLLSQIPDVMPKAVPNDPAPEAPTENSPVFSRRERSRLIQRSGVRNQTRTNSPVASSSSYIDPTDYSLGATTRRNSPSRSYEPPSSVVLTERSTGCQRVVRGGLAGNGCGNSVASTRTRVRRNSIASDSYSISRRQRSRDIVRSSQVANQPRSDQSNRLSRSPQTEFQSRSYQLSRVPRSTSNDRQVREYRLSRVPRPRTTSNDRQVRSYQLSRVPRSTSNDRQVREYRLSRLPRTNSNDNQVQSSQLSRLPRTNSNDNQFREYRLSRLPRTNSNDNQFREYRLSSVPRFNQTNRVNRTSPNNSLQRSTVNDRYVSANQNTWQPKQRSAIVASIRSVNLGSESIAPRKYPITQNPTIGINGNNQISNDPTIRARALEYYYKNKNSLDSQTTLLGNSTLPIVFPLAVPSQITSMFGWRIHPISGDRRFHAGTDIGAPMGTPVLAAHPGRVTMAEYMGGYGLSIVIRHNNDKQETRYAHLSAILVQPGQWVEQGTLIGNVGSTGNSTGPHLHFEVRELTPQGWVAMNPSAQLEYGLDQLGRNFSVGALSQKFNPIQNNSKPTTSNRDSSVASSPQFLAPNFVPKLPPLQPLIPVSQLPEIVISAIPSSQSSLPEAQTTSQLPKVTLPKNSEVTAQVPQITLPENSEVTAQIPQITLPENSEVTAQIPQITLPENSEVTAQIPQITLPKTSKATAQIPKIKIPITKPFEVPLPKLQPISTQIEELLLPALQKIKIQPHIGI